MKLFRVVCFSAALLPSVVCAKSGEAVLDADNRITWRDAVVYDVLGAEGRHEIIAYDMKTGILFMKIVDGKLEFLKTK